MDLNSFGVVELTNSEKVDCNGGHAWIELKVKIAQKLLEILDEIVDGVTDGYNAASEIYN